MGPDDIVGHKTFRDGALSFRHEPLTRLEKDSLMRAAEERERQRAERMPDEAAAVRALFEAWQRLKELGWREGKYAPRDGRLYREIQLGSPGIVSGACTGEWPHCTWTTFGAGDAYPSSQAPALFRLDAEAERRS